MIIGLLLHEYVEHSRQNVDDWSIRRKNEQKGRDLQRYSWQQDNIEGYDWTWLNEKVVPDSRCYCWETNRLTVEVVEWGPRIYEIETNYKTLRVIGHWSDFEVKILYRSSSLSKIILYREFNGK